MLLESRLVPVGEKPASSILSGSLLGTNGKCGTAPSAIHIVD